MGGFCAAVSSANDRKMNRIKCPHCGLVNAVSDGYCRRCGCETAPNTNASRNRKGPRAEAKSSSWLYTLLFVAAVGGGAYYIFTGVEKSYDKVQSNNASRISSQARPQTAGLSARDEYEQKRKGAYKSALQNNPSFTASDQRLAEANKLMQPNGGQPQK